MSSRAVRIGESEFSSEVSQVVLSTIDSLSRFLTSSSTLIHIVSNSSVIAEKVASGVSYLSSHFIFVEIKIRISL